MADIPSARAKVNDLEVAADAPATEALMNKLSANMNDYLDKTLNYVEFTSNDTWTAPDYTEWIIIQGCGGGGGGGGGGADGGGGGDSGGGSGGSGAPVSLIIKQVTPSTTYTIEIGAGGAGGAGGSGPIPGNGTAGSDGSPSYFKNGSDILAIFYGGKGGDFGRGFGGVGGASVGITVDYTGFNTPSGAGGNPSGGSSFFGQPGLESTNGFAGGASGGGLSAGGGGGGSLGAGGAGGAAGVPTVGLPGTSGGGGGGGGGGRSFATGAAGGAGGSGKVIIYWYGNT